MGTNNAGGGEILDYVGKSQTKRPSYLDDAVIQQFATLPFVRIIIMLLIIVIAIIVIMKIMEVRNPLRGRAVTNELEHLDKVKKRDESIIKANRVINIVTKLIEKSPFTLSKSYIDYWSYNLERANVRIPGGARIIKPQEFNAIIKVVEIFVMCIGVILIILVSAPVGVLLIAFTWVAASTLPMQVVRSTVKAKDNEIVENFADFYLMIHYVLLASAGTPISGIMKSYDKTTTSDEMHRFVDVCIHYIDTYGEYEATRYISRQYREIPQVGKLMRLIRQANEGGDIRAELIGFRDELLSAKKYTILKRMERLVMQAQASFNILVPVLIQAVLSAMAIYIEDLKLTSTFM